MALLTDFWDSPEWHAYEAAYGDAPGTRARLLASATWRTRVLDLRPPEPELWRGVRRSYHSLIHAAERRFALCPESGSGACYIIRTAQLVHRLDAGRQTRPGKTWDLMGDLLEADPPCVLVWADGGGAINRLMAADPTVGIETEAGWLSGLPEYWPDMAGYAYFFRHGDWAYYASAATLERNLNHALVWRGILALKAHGVRTLELGWQGQALDRKGQAIEFFRRGFGGEDVGLV